MDLTISKPLPAYLSVSDRMVGFPLRQDSRCSGYSLGSDDYTKGIDVFATTRINDVDVFFWKSGDTAYIVKAFGIDVHIRSRNITDVMVQNATYRGSFFDVNVPYANQTVVVVVIDYVEYFFYLMLVTSDQIDTPKRPASLIRVTYEQLVNSTINAIAGGVLGVLVLSRFRRSRI